MEQTAQILDKETFREKFGLWFPKFEKFIESKEMWDIYQRIKADSKYETICPSSKDTFKAFATTNPANIKAIFYLMDPYPRLYKDGKMQATGIAMDCSNSEEGIIQPSLKNWYDTMSKELGKKVEYSPSLDYLHEQGIMLLNTDLTCKLNKTESHKGLWSPFQKYFLEEVMYGTTGIVYVLCGKSSRRMEKYINPLGNYIYFLDHPAAATRSHTTWDSEGIFTKISNIVKQNNGYDIYWDKRDWDNYKDPPF